MEDDPKKLAMLIMAKGKGGEEKPEADDFDSGESSSGADAFSEAVKLAMKGDKEGAFNAFKVAMSSSEDYE